MKNLLIVCLFSLSLNTFAQTASVSIEQTFIFQLVDKNGKSLNFKTIKKKTGNIKTKDSNCFIYSNLGIKFGFVIVREGLRYYGDYNYIRGADVVLIYKHKDKTMTIIIKNIQAAYFKITAIPFKSGNYVIDLQRESDFVKKMIIKPTEWKKDKVVFQKVEKEIGL